MFEAPPGPGELFLGSRQGLASCVWSPTRVWRVVFGVPPGPGETTAGITAGMTVAMPVGSGDLPC